MIKYFCASILIFVALSVNSQVIVDHTDMPVSGDIIYFRSANNLNGINYQLTDTAYTWDFSSLSSTTLAVDTFVSVNSTGMVYSAVFFQATSAQPIAMQTIPMISITEGYNFFKNTTSMYSILGLGAKVNGFPVPLKFDNQDVLYNFPVTYGAMDTSDSEAHTNIPGIGYLGHVVHRENVVDGWGTLYLPADTFEVIRVKSKVSYYDTIFYDSIGFGGGFTRNVTEYKWLTDGFHGPVLQITKQGGGGNNITVKYYNHIPTDLSVGSINQGSLKVFPNPASDFIAIEIPGPVDEAILTVTDITGRVLTKTMIQQQQIVLPVSQWQKGIYFVQISDSRETYCGKFIKY